MVVYLSLGSNIGDRKNHLRTAITQLADPQFRVIRTSSVYITEPRDYADQDRFLNIVLEADTQFGPFDLLKRCQMLERDAGRARTISKGPRTLDIDIIFYDSLVLRTFELTIPHPRYAERRFVLTPLAEIAGEFVDPQRRMTVQQLVKMCADPSEVVLHSEPLL
jgi:2-amino-4-hydroxy-6-hydroxymethyldihydropteridine diphosphokinase